MDIFTLVSQLMMQVRKDAKDVLDKENSEILQADLTLVDDLVLDIIPGFQNEHKEAFKIWLQLLHNCLTKAKSVLHRYSPSQRQRCLECLICKPGRLFKEIKEWELLFDYLCQGIRRDLSVVLGGREAVVTPVIAPVIPLMKDVIEKEESHQILETKLRPLDILLLDISAVFQDQHKAAPEALKIWLQLLQNCLTEANSILHCNDPDAGRRCKQVSEWRVIFDHLFRGLQKDFSLFLSADQIIKRDLVIPAMTEEGLLQPLSKDEAWELFRGIAFCNDKHVPMDIEERAKNIADECKGSRLAIILVAAALRGKSRADEWETSLSSIKNPDPASPDTLPPHIDAEFYQRFKWSYNALPNSDVKNCFLYCAMYPKNENIRVEELVQMWVAEGLVRSQQENHLVDMDIGLSYVDLLVDRRLFHYPTDEENCLWGLQQNRDIRVHDVIREMAIYIGEKEENCVFKVHQGLQNFPNEDCKRISLLKDDFENLPTEFPACPKLASLLACTKLVSLMLSTDDLIEKVPPRSLLKDDIENLPTEFPACPKLVSLLACTKLVSPMLSTDDSIEEVPPRFLSRLTSLKVINLHNSFLFRLTSLKVLNLQNSRGINSIPSSLGQLKQLQFLSLRGLQSIQDLPEAIGDLSSLQFLDLQDCGRLQSLPSQIGKLQNLKHLSLIGCNELKVIPHEMSHLTSLTTLHAGGVALSVAAESEARSIWRLKGLRNLTLLSLTVKGTTSSSSRIEEGIMGTWWHMRHLYLWFDSDDVMVDLPHDMKKMSKLQLFDMQKYRGSSLPEYICKFQHLEAISLFGCHQLRELSPLERVPNLKALRLYGCGGLKELGIGNSDGFLMLERLVLNCLNKLESIGGAFNNGVWNERTLPRLRMLVIYNCPELKRLPVGMDKLPKLSKILADKDQWNQIIWEDDDMKIRLQRFYKEW